MYNSLNSLQQAVISSCSPLHAAIRLGDLKLVKYFVDNGVDINLQDDFGETALLHAASTARLEIVKYLVEKGADKELRDRTESTPLHCAVRCVADVEMVEYLVDNGADKGARDHLGKTPLCYAVTMGNLDFVKCLVKNGARDFEGVTPLHEAVWRGYLEVTKVLLHAGFNVNAKNSLGETPLHVAFRLSRPCRSQIAFKEIVKTLLSYYPDVSLKDRREVSALQLIQKQDFSFAKEIVENLRAQDKKRLVVFYQESRNRQDSHVAKLPNDLVKEILRFYRPSHTPSEVWEKDILKAETLCFGAQSKASRHKEEAISDVGVCQRLR